MRFQIAVDATAANGGVAGGVTAEKVFRVIKNSFTATSTITAGSFVRGNPVILTVASASNDGYSVVHADTSGQPTNDLFVGVVYDYPDSTGTKTGVFQPEAVGWAQAYGLATYAVVGNTTATQSAPAILVPNTGSQLVTIGQLIIPTGTGTSATGAAVGGVAGLAVLYQTLASSSAAGTTAASVFLRCL